MGKRSKGRKLNDLLKFMRESSFEEGEMKNLREEKAKFFRGKSGKTQFEKKSFKKKFNERRFDLGPAQSRNKEF